MMICGILFHDAVVAQHLRVRGQCAAGHGAPGNQRFDRGRFGRQEVVTHAVLEDFFGLPHFLDIDVQFVFDPRSACHMTRMSGWQVPPEQGAIERSMASAPASSAALLASTLTPAVSWVWK